MDQTKLTVRVPRDLLNQAKQYARDHDTNLTRLVSAFLQQLSHQRETPADAPIVRRLGGILLAESSVDEYHGYLEDKYGVQTPGAG